MKAKNLIIGVLIVAGFISLGLYDHSGKKKIVYVKVSELYNDFEMKKELENTYLMIQKSRKHQLDSLELELKFLNSKINAEGEKAELVHAFQVKRENYLLKKQQFEEDDAQMQQQYTDKIKKQLNQYVADFGKEKNIDYIFGAEGSGALMYAKEGDDVTKEALVYVNNKFKGGQ